MTDVEIGSVLGGYRIEELIGHGGMGVVYRATQLRLSRTVAVKVIMPTLAGDLEFRARFESESRVAASIDHNHVVPIYEADEVDGLLFIAMRYVEGQDLRSLIESEGSLDADRAARIIAQIGSALDAAHRRGLVHRDVKPGNILISGSGEDEHAYLTDFGLTKKMSDAGMTKTGQWVGTLDYAAPEQINGQSVDARTDVYALGCVLFHALTGQVPYVRDSDVAKMYAHLHDPAPPVTEVKSDVPEAMAAVVARAMVKDPGARFPSAGDVGRAARAAAEGSVKELPERSVAVGEAAPEPAEVTRVTAEPPAAAAPPTALTPQPAEPTRAAAPRPTPPPASAQAPAPQPTPATPFLGGTPSVASSAAGSSGSGNRSLLIAIIALLALVVTGGGLFAAGVFDSGETTISKTEDPTVEPTVAPTVEATATVSAEATTTTEATPIPSVVDTGGDFCQNSFISPAERDALRFAQGVSEQAVEGTVFYGECEGKTWAIASFPDGSTGVFRQFGRAWNRLGSFAVARCRVPNDLLSQWRQQICVQGE